MGKRLSGYAVFALFFLIVVKAVRFFVRQPGGGWIAFLLRGVLRPLGYLAWPSSWRGGRQSRKAGQRRILSLSILLVLVTGFFLLMDYREYAMLRQVTALLGGAA